MKHNLAKSESDKENCLFQDLQVNADICCPMVYLLNNRVTVSLQGGMTAGVPRLLFLTLQKITQGPQNTVTELLVTSHFAVCTGAQPLAFTKHLWGRGHGSYTKCLVSFGQERRGKEREGEGKNVLFFSFWVSLWLCHLPRWQTWSGCRGLHQPAPTQPHTQAQDGSSAPGSLSCHLVPHVLMFFPLAASSTSEMW